MRSEVDPSGSPIVKRLNKRCSITPGRHNLAGGIDDAADGSLRSNQFPLRGAGINTFQMTAV
jgi:hypothetical protein